MESRPNRRHVRRLAPLLAVALAGCASPGRPGPPRPGWTSGPPVTLDGMRVLVMPAQNVRGVGGDIDAEVAFGLETRAPNVAWILPGELRRALQRSPGLQANPDALPVGMFLQAEVRRVGDPLYGELRRMGALTDAAAAFVPVTVRARPANDSVAAAVEIVAALIDVRSGGVLWSGVVEGPGRAGDPATLAAAVDALARAFLGTMDDDQWTGPAREAAPHRGDDDGTQDADGGGGAPGRRPDRGDDGVSGHQPGRAHGSGSGGLLRLLR